MRARGWGDIAARLARLEQPADQYREIRHLGRVVAEMLHDALDALARMDAAAALEVARRDRLIRVRSELERRLRVFINLPFEALDRMSAQRHVDEIGGEARAEPPQLGSGGAASHDTR